jgi:hypothetical protein
MQFRCLLRHLTPVCQNYHIGDGTKALVESTKEGLEKLGKTLGIVPDFERDVFDVPLAYPASEPRMLGVFVKDASVELTNSAVELFP